MTIGDTNKAGNPEHEAAFDQWWQIAGLKDPMQDGSQYYFTAINWARHGYLAAMKAQHDLIIQVANAVFDETVMAAYPAEDGAGVIFGHVDITAIVDRYTAQPTAVTTAVKKTLIDQAEPAAWAVLTENGSCRIWFGRKDSADKWARDHCNEAEITPLYKLPPAMATSLTDIAAERWRQIEEEGWTPEHDDRYHMHTLTAAAGCYAMHTLAYPAGAPPKAWPWPAEWWKPSADPRQNWVKAGALCAAEIERFDRAQQKGRIT